MVMNLAEYSKYDALGLAELVQMKEISSKELALTALKAIEKVNPEINAVIEVFHDKIDDLEATALTAGPFGGVPFLLKDIGCTEAGRKQEMGSRFMEGFVADQDSYLMTKFNQAGLINLGRTTTPEFALSSSTESVLTGDTHNPWAPGRMAGGSSGGAAASVASGIVPVAHASDGAGSIRIPASCCGLVGLKSSRARVSSGPGRAEALFGLSVEFVVTRSVRDSAAMLDAVQGPGIGDPYIILTPERTYMEEIQTPPGKLRIAFTKDPWSEFPVDDEIANAVVSLAEKLEAMGHEVSLDSPSYDYESYLNATLPFWCAGFPSMLEQHSERSGRPINLEYLESVTLAFYEFGKQLTASDLAQSHVTFNHIRRDVGKFFQKYDLLLTPTLSLLPQLIGMFSQNVEGTDAIAFFKLCDEINQHLPLFNLTGQPAISLPLYQSKSGLPVGMQFVSRFGDEATLFRLASALEKEMPWIDRKPLVHVSVD
jgi:amidase